jgi:ubiquinone biosynthesis protein UbiJ
MNGSLDPALVTAVLSALENGLNRALELAPETRSRLEPFADDVFALHCTAPALDVYVRPGEEGLQLMGVYDGAVTTSVRGVASDFAELAMAKDPAATLINGQLELEGDSAPLLELRKVLAGLDMDWEAPLVAAMGDVAGHQFAQMLRATYGWGRQATASLTRQLDEFIHEEARITPPRLELEDFYRDVQALGLQVERLASRVERLRRKLHKLRP